MNAIRNVMGTVKNFVVDSFENLHLQTTPAQTRCNEEEEQELLTPLSLRQVICGNGFGVPSLEKLEAQLYPNLRRDSTWLTSNRDEMLDFEDDPTALCTLKEAWLSLFDDDFADSSVVGMCLTCAPDGTDSILTGIYVYIEISLFAVGERCQQDSLPELVDVLMKISMPSQTDDRMISRMDFSRTAQGAEMFWQQVLEPELFGIALSALNPTDRVDACAPRKKEDDSFAENEEDESDGSDADELSNPAEDLPDNNTPLGLHRNFDLTRLIIPEVQLFHLQPRH